MKKFIQNHKDLFSILCLLLGFRVYLFIAEMLSSRFPVRSGYIGFIPQANFDGVFYLNISQFGYRGLDQAFFPFYPMMVNFVATGMSVQPAVGGLIVSILSCFFVLYILNKLLYINKFKTLKSHIWVFLFLLFFPAAFFLSSIYTESLFLALVLLSFYFAQKKKRTLACLVAMLATGTRIVGIFLLPALLIEFYIQYTSLDINTRDKNLTSSEPSLFARKLAKSKLRIKIFSPLFLVPLGLLSYMSYLWYRFLDPLLFVHIQPAFGAGRSGDGIVLLPQVLFRYVKIIFTVPPSEMSLYVAVLEISTLFICLFLLFLGYKKNIRLSFIIFSVCVLLFPTLSGTLSSLPRYAIVCFPIFMYLGMINNRYIKIGLLAISLGLESILAILFFRGYFVS